MSLKDKVIFMSGGSRGIGLAMAKKAAQDGAKIIVAAKTAEPHPKLPGTIYTAAEEIIEAGGDALPVICDIRNEDNVRDAINKSVEHFGGLDICINNASAIQLTNVVDTEMKRYDLMHQINGRGTYMVSKYCLPHLTKSSIQKFPVKVLESLVKISYAASAMMSTFRESFIISSPPR